MVIFLALFSLLVTAFSARFFLAAVVEGPSRVRHRDFSVMAQQVSRWYRILSWGMITTVLLGTLIQLFMEAVRPLL